MTSQCVIHNWLIDISSGSLIHQITGEQHRLGEYQLKLLIVLVQNAGKILTREELNTLVWERRVIGNNSLPNAIHALRVALEDDGKQQRIIKTIPKKGYILEPAFCVFQREPAQAEASPAQVPATTEAQQESDRDDALRSDTLPAADAPAPDLMETPQAEWTKASGRENQRRKEAREKKHNRFWRSIAIGQCFVLISLIAFLGYSNLLTPANRFHEEEAGSYSNIALYELVRTQGNEKTPTGIVTTLFPTLYALNQMLKSQNITMRVYYSASENALHYTMTLTSACDRRQLVMNITQWRSNKTQLNALIYRETERKINEMAQCVR